jgi:hypothetical protein
MFGGGWWRNLRSFATLPIRSVVVMTTLSQNTLFTKVNTNSSALQHDETFAGLAVFVLENLIYQALFLSFSLSLLEK